MKHRFISAAFATLSIAAAQGQAFERRVFDGPGSDSFTEYHWVDFNADGALDILEVNPYGEAVLHISQGGSFISTNVTLEGVRFPEGRCAFNDYDGDGDVDILASDESSLVIVNYDETNGLNVVPTGITFTRVDYGKIYWVDVDGDLKLDVIHGRKTFLNHQGVYVESRFLFPELLSNMTLEDVNNDGLPDAIAAGYESYNGAELTIYINLGEGQFSETGITLPQAELRSNSITLFDHDGDSDIDVFALDLHGRGWIFKNSLAETGEVAFESSHILSDRWLSLVIPSDLNSDGLQDLVIATSTSLTVLTNTSSEGVISFVEETHDLQLDLFDGLAVVDIDGDDDIDIQVKGYSYNNGSQNWIFENVGVPPGSAPSAPANLATVVEKNVSLSWNSIPGLFYNIELTQNGSIYSPTYTSPSGRLLVPPGNFLRRSGTFVLRGLPAGTYEWRVQAIDASGRVSDFSSSGTFSIDIGPSSLTSTALDLTTVELCWTYNGMGSPTYRIFRRTSSGVAVEIADIDGGVTCYVDDTVPENDLAEYFVVAVNGEAYSAPSNTVIHHSTLFVKTSFGTSDPNIISARCFPADYDMDGDYDLQFAGRVNNTNSVLLQNDGTGLFTPGGGLSYADAIQLPYNETMGPRDLDNDGDPDLVFTTGSEYSWQKISVFINDNGTFVKGFETPAYLQTRLLVVEDLNNDGRLDLLFSHVIGNSSGNPGQTQLLYQTADGSFEDSKIDLTKMGVPKLLFSWCADVNSDGFMDLFCASADNSFMELLMNEQGMAFSKTTTILPYTTSMGVADYTGDGNIDVLMAGHEGLHLYSGVGNFTFQEPKVIPVEYFSSGLKYVHADIDLNGLSDLLLTDGYNSRVMLNNGNGSFKSANITLEGNRGASLAITDFENDGDIDIVKLGNDGQHQGLNHFYRNQLADLNVMNGAPSAPEGLSASFASGSARFTWSPASDDHTPSSLLTYNLWVVDDNGKLWLSPETTESGNFRRQFRDGNAGHSTTRSLNNLPAGLYKARVQSIDASFSLSPWSEEIELSIQEGPTDLAVERILLNKVKLSWTASPYDESAVIVQRKTPASKWEVIAELAAGTTLYTDSELEYNNLYQYRVLEASASETTAISNIADWSTNMWIIEDTDIANLYGSMDVADFTGDGLMDMVLNGAMIYSGYSEDITRATFENTPDGWMKVDITPSDLTQTAQIAFTDLNGDFDPDIYQHGYIWASGYKTETFLNNGDKTFTPVTNLFTTGTYAIQSYFDFDMDNDLDVVATQAGSYPTVREMFQNNGEGNYTSVDNMTCNSCPTNVGVADFDQDGDEDVIRLESGVYQLHLNTPEGLGPTAASFPAYENQIAVTDYNSDGLPDVVLLTSSYYNTGKVFKNQGLRADGSLDFVELPLKLSSGDPSLLSADFDHDGRTDLAAISPNVNVLLNKGDDAFQEFIVPGYRVSLHIAGLVDFDNDGDLDIYFSGYHQKDHSGYGRKAKILLNQTIVGTQGIMNAPPDAPASLSSTQDENGVHLTWNKPHDDHTSPEGLTYDVVLFRNGKAITKGDHAPETGQRVRLTRGRSTGVATFNNLLPGPYAWRVQAIDGSFAGSVLSEEGTFTFLPAPPVIRDTLIYKCGRTITLTAQGTDIQWYKDESLTQLIGSESLHPEESQVVYAVQNIDGYQGLPKRVQITVHDKPPVPTFSQANPFTICENWSGSPTLFASGEDIRWYLDEDLERLLANGAYVQVQATDASYFVTQTLQSCESNALMVEVETTSIDSRLYYSDDAIRTRELDGDNYNWYKNGLFYQSTTVPYIPFDGETATYVVSIMKGQCQEYSEPFISSKENITSLEIEGQWDFEVYPNPASDQVMLRFQKPNTVISIYDPLGNLIYTKPGDLNGEQVIDTGRWSNGIYLVVIDDGKKVYKQRLAIL